MVERVARALFDEGERQLRAAYPDRDPKEWRCRTEFDKVSHHAFAVAAIRAMREPDERMLKVGGAVLVEGRDFRSIWDAAIGTAIGVPERELGRRGGMAAP